MPTWGELGDELVAIRETHDPATAAGLSPADILRRKYLTRLSDFTNRTTILYYSGWLGKPDAPPEHTSVGLIDVAGFMEACSNASTRDLDLIVHSPGGDPDAAEQICEYLRKRFDSIRVIVPLAAMSAGTMIALSSDCIVMGEHSQLGPIDPQLFVQTPEGQRASSAQAVRDQFDVAKAELSQDPTLSAAWLPILRMYGPGLLAACDHATQRGNQIVSKAMERYMLAGDPEAAQKASEAAAWFSDAKTFLSHGRPVRRDEAREHHVVVEDLEDDAEFQDRALSAHHAAMLTLQNTGATKLIENDKGRAYILMVSQAPVQIVQAEPAEPGPAAPGAPNAKKAPPKPPRKQRRKR